MDASAAADAESCRSRFGSLWAVIILTKMQPTKKQNPPRSPHPQVNKVKGERWDSGVGGDQTDSRASDAPRTT